MTMQVTAATLTAAKEQQLPTALARLRFRHGLTIREVCEAVGIPSPGMLSVWEAGKYGPSAEYVRRLATFYGVPAATLVSAKRRWPAA